MPIAVDPSARVPFVLESDRGKDNPPTFYLRPLTVREFRTADTIDERLRAAASCGGDPITVLMDGIRFGLVGWESMTNGKGEAVSYDPAALEDVIGMDEAYELMRGVQTAGKVSAVEKKESALPPSSSTDNCAGTAPTESA